jgi:alkylation response protein AidB-like acyl-CoA dehydrogenase
MDFKIPAALKEEKNQFKTFLDGQVRSKLSKWYRNGEIPRTFYQTMGAGGWLNFEIKNNELRKRSALRGMIIEEQLAIESPGLSIATLAHVDLGLTGLYLFGSENLKQRYALSAVEGETLICLGNTEGHAGSDAAAINMRAEKIDDGWLLNGTKAYVTNGLVSDFALITAVSEPNAPRSSRISLFWVDLSAKGVIRRKLNKKVWIPSDLTRVQLEDVFVPASHLVGLPGRGLQQVLEIFSFSRVPISALTLGTAVGAFELAVRHARKRKVLGRHILDFQSKAFEMADLYARIEAARLMLLKACWAMDSRQDFRLESSLAKYLTVRIAREVTTWSADVFGAASVIFEHPVHKFPLDAWASSLGEGTQDVQKLVIFRELMKRYGR